MTDPRKPLWSCPHCNEKRYSVIGCWGIKQHLWREHGIPGEFKFNGRTKYFGNFIGPRVPDFIEEN